MAATQHLDTGGDILETSYENLGKISYPMKIIGKYLASINLELGNNNAINLINTFIFASRLGRYYATLPLNCE